MVPNLRIFVFAPSFAIRQIRGCWFQLWQQHFQFLAQNLQNQKFFVPSFNILKSGIFGLKLKIFIFELNFAMRKCEGVDLRCDKSFPKLLPKIFEQDILGPKLKNFYICTKLCYKINLKVLVSNKITDFLKCQSQNNQIKHWRIFYFARSFSFWKIWCCFKYDNSFFLMLAYKYPNKAISVLNLRICISFDWACLNRWVHLISRK